MTTIDMLADHPGTWMFHCHVQDHMEAGMMAVYTVYGAPAARLPACFQSGRFGSIRKTLRSPSKTPAPSRLPASRSHPRCFWHSRICGDPSTPSVHRISRFCRSGANSRKTGDRAASAQSVLGWVFFPYSVKYEDGTSWHPQSEGEGFTVIWRDPQASR